MSKYSFPNHRSTVQFSFPTSVNMTVESLKSKSFAPYAEEVNKWNPPVELARSFRSIRKTKSLKCSSSSPGLPITTRAGILARLHVRNESTPANEAEIQGRRQAGGRRAEGGREREWTGGELTGMSFWSINKYNLPFKDAKSGNPKRYQHTNYKPNKKPLRLRRFSLAPGLHQ